ncbi:hypothetical protein [Ponticaulis koreensis]|uniref:hypothetical protein n=1 Tax=Ponticaulis koreensis TaxID=1123045 RepID=UPI0003B759BC|nr:hypothetical protein [Ponticaulis koreensis]
MKSEQGYATPVVLGFIAVMSLVAVWAFNLALAQNREVQARQQLWLLKLSFSSLIEEQIFQVLDRPQNVQLRPQFLTVSETNAVLEVTNEHARPNLLYADEAQLRTDLQRLLPPGTDAERILRDRNLWQLGSAPGSITELIGDLELTGRLEECVADRFTVYASTVDPLASGQIRSNLAGAILRIIVKTLPDETPSLRLQAIVLFTGNAERPFEILEWVEDQRTQDVSCSTR